MTEPKFPHLYPPKSILGRGSFDSNYSYHLYKLLCFSFLAVVSLSIPYFGDLPSLLFTELFNLGEVSWFSLMDSESLHTFLIGFRSRV